MFETFLLFTTVISLGVALVLGLLLRRVSRDERDRSAARVAALAALAGGLPELAPIPTPDPSPSASFEDEWELSEVEPVAASVSAVHSEQSLPPGFAPVPVSAASGPDLSASQPFASTNRSATPEERRQRRLALAAAGVGMLVVGGFVLAVTSNGATAGAAEAALAAAPVDLLRLAHNRTANAMTVHGTVRNPARGATLLELDAVVQLFDRSGNVVAEQSGRTVDPALAANEETSFSVTMTAPADVVRYRVSFRSGSRAVAHIDRRGDVQPRTAAPGAGTATGGATRRGDPSGSPGSEE